MGRPIKVSEAQGRQDSGNRDRFSNNRNQGNQGNGFNRNNQPQGDVNIETSTLFIGNISFKSSPESMKRFFGRIGEVVSTRIVTDKETGKVISLFNLESRFRIC